MRPGMKMLMLNSRNNGNRMESRSEMNNAGMNYGMDNEMEMRRRYRRDSGGRFRSEMGGDMEMDNMEARRRRDSRGRFRSEMTDGNTGMEMESNYGNSEMGGYPGRPFPVYEDGRSNMNRIGFNAGGHEVQTNYRMNATHQTGNEMEYRSSPKMGGGYSSDMAMPMTKETAERWIHHMKHADGSKGPHWKLEDAKRIMEQKKIQCNPYEFAAILNAMYSDYCNVLRKHGVESDDLYVDLACAWLMDDDAMPGKAMLYYNCIVEK